MTERDKSERLLLWAAALKDLDYMAAMKKIPEILTTSRWFPRIAELIDALKSRKPDPLVIMSAQDAEYRRIFPDWVNDGLTRGQWLARMEKKLGKAENMRLEQ